MGVGVALATLAMFTVWTAISILRRGNVYHWLRPEHRPRRWVLVAVLQLFAVFCAWFPVWMCRPEAFISRLLLLSFSVDFFITGITLKWFTPFVDRLVQRRGLKLR